MSEEPTYIIMKYWHPSSGKEPERYDPDCEYTGDGAQAVCSQGSYKEGPQSEWYFLGYIKSERSDEDESNDDD